MQSQIQTHNKKLLIFPLSLIFGFDFVKAIIKHINNHQIGYFCIYKEFFNDKRISKSHIRTIS